MENKTDNDVLARLREKAAALPMSPGVYIMHDKGGSVIYVGKSRHLKNRVSQYFHGAHDVKTTRMASSVYDFKFIVCRSEMEALILENNLIKQYKPKYNILLKDAKAYPYIKVTEGEYPRFVLARTRGDKGEYYGPYSSGAVVHSVISSVSRAMGLPSCSKRFPSDIGKGRTCVYYQMGQCCGLCSGRVSAEEYGSLVSCAKRMIKGDTAEALADLEKRMAEAAAEERFEEAARCRDSIAALKKLGQKQVTALAPDSDMDVIGLSSEAGVECASVFYVRGGSIADSEHFLFGENEITGAGDLSFKVVEESDDDRDDPMVAFITSLYSVREDIPREVLLSFKMGEYDTEVLSGYLTKRAGHKVVVRTPERGDGRRLCLMAVGDARRHGENHRRRRTADERTLEALGEALGLHEMPRRIEAYDISNMGSDNVTAGMIVCEDCKFVRSDYRSFKIKWQEGQDDYGAMREALLRRLSHLKDGEGAFAKRPDLILLDGGMNHVAVGREAMREAGVSIPVFGMVKDEHHKTRTIVSECEELSIARDAALFRFVYGIQDEVHRYTITRMKQAKSAGVKHSTLEKIQGIGPAKAKTLLAHFKTVTALKGASIAEIEKVRGVGNADAKRIYEYFHSGDAEGTDE